MKKSMVSSLFISILSLFLFGLIMTGCTSNQDKTEIIETSYQYQSSEEYSELEEVSELTNDSVSEEIEPTINEAVKKHDESSVILEDKYVDRNDEGITFDVSTAFLDIYADPNDKQILVVKLTRKVTDTSGIDGQSFITPIMGITDYMSLLGNQAYYKDSEYDQNSPLHKVTPEKIYTSEDKKTALFEITHSIKKFKVNDVPDFQALKSQIYFMNGLDYNKPVTNLENRVYKNLLGETIEVPFNIKISEYGLSIIR